MECSGPFTEGGGEEGVETVLRLRARGGKYWGREERGIGRNGGRGKVVN